MKKRSSLKTVERMLWCYGFLLSLLLEDAYGNVSKNRVRRQNLPIQNGQVIDDIFNIPITAIKQTAAAAQVFSPENNRYTQTIDTVAKIPVSTLEAVGALLKSTSEQRQRNTENIQKIRQERRDRLLARKEQKQKEKVEIQNQRLQQQLKRVVRHHNKDPFGLYALSDVLIGHHGLLGHHSTFSGIHRGGHNFGFHNHGIHSSHGNRPQNTYAVHENVNEDTSSFSWHGLTAGFGSYFGTRPSNADIKIENKIAPKERKQKISKYPSDNASFSNNIGKIKNRPERKNSPLENKIAPKTSKVTFV